MSVTYGAGIEVKADHHDNDHHGHEVFRWHCGCSENTKLEADYITMKINTKTLDLGSIDNNLNNRKLKVKDSDLYEANCM